MLRGTFAGRGPAPDGPPLAVDARGPHNRDVDAQTLDLGELYVVQASRLARSLRSICPDQAEDIVQEAYAIAARRWAEVEACDEPLAWITTVATRLAWRTKQREGSRRRREAVAEAHRPEYTRQRYSDPDLARAIASLPHPQAAAVKLYYLRDRPVAEVARHLGVPEATVKTWLRRARITLAEVLGDLSGRWISEGLVGPDWCAAWMREHGLGDQTEEILVHMPQRRVRWVLEVAHGNFWFGTDSGEHFDNGTHRLCGNVITHHQVPHPPSDTSYEVDRDGDRLRLRLRETSVPEVGGVAARIHEQLIHHLPLSYAGQISAVSV